MFPAIAPSSTKFPQVRSDLAHAESTVIIVIHNPVMLSIYCLAVLQQSLSKFELQYGPGQAIGSLR